MVCDVVLGLKLVLAIALGGVARVSLAELELAGRSSAAGCAARLAVACFVGRTRSNGRLRSASVFLRRHALAGMRSITIFIRKPGNGKQGNMRSKIGGSLHRSDLVDLRIGQAETQNSLV